MCKVEVEEASKFLKPRVPLVRRRVVCQQCGGQDHVEDVSAGTVVCRNCGNVLEERVLSSELEYHTFEGEEDGEKKVRVSGSFNMNDTHAFIGTDQKYLGQRDENEFLKDGLRDIERGLRRTLKGGRNARAEARAKEIFRRAFHWMYLQKNGINKVFVDDESRDFSKREDAKTETAKKEDYEKDLSEDIISLTAAAKLTRKRRQMYARRKAFAMASIMYALAEQGIRRTVDDLNPAVEGKTVVQEHSIVQCLRDIGMTPK